MGDLGAKLWIMRTLLVLQGRWPMRQLRWAGPRAPRIDLKDVDAGPAGKNQTKHARRVQEGRFDRRA